jgi:hypothetical protein
MNSKFRYVQLPEDLCAAAEARYGRHFASIDDLLTFTLRELLRGDAAQLNAAEERILEERLRDLGYV